MTRMSKDTDALRDTAGKTISMECHSESERYAQICGTQGGHQNRSANWGKAWGKPNGAVTSSSVCPCDSFIPPSGCPTRQDLKAPQHSRRPPQPFSPEVVHRSFTVESRVGLNHEENIGGFIGGHKGIPRVSELLKAESHWNLKACLVPRTWSD